jgi:hypothetical protein
VVRDQLDLVLLVLPITAVHAGGCVEAVGGSGGDGHEDNITGSSRDLSGRGVAP